MGVVLGLMIEGVRGSGGMVSGGGMGAFVALPPLKRKKITIAKINNSKQKFKGVEPTSLVKSINFNSTVSRLTRSSRSHYRLLNTTSAKIDHGHHDGAIETIISIYVHLLRSKVYNYSELLYFALMSNKNSNNNDNDNVISLQKYSFH